MILEPEEREMLEHERRAIENEVNRLKLEIEHLGASQSTNAALWLQARCSFTESRLNTIKVKLGIW